MQVATLFRESQTLLGAGMESGVGVGGSSGGGGSAQDTAGPQQLMSGPGIAALSLDNFSHPASNKFKVTMKLEPQDDGYETSGDMVLPPSTANQNEGVGGVTIKREPLEDPYSFIDDDPMSMMSGSQSQQQPHCIQQPSAIPPNSLLPTPKKRGRKKKIKNEPGLEEFGSPLNNKKRPFTKERKKHDRFNGMPEEEVSKRTLPDHLTTNLDIIIIGINPGLFAAYKGHHYAGPGNHFWKCLYLSGLTSEQMTADEDYKLLQVGIGFTNMVQRPTKGSADLTRKEIKEGSQILLEKLQRFRPKIAVFNGKLIYEVFSGKKDFSFGRQPDLVDGTNTYMWVMPSSSARCAQLPRAADKVPFYAALKKFRDYLNGIVTSIEDSEVVFTDSRLKPCYEPEPKIESGYSTEIMDISNATVKREEVVPCKKKRGRPKKIKTEGEEPPKPVVRKPPTTQNSNNCDFPKKKRGRPKKIKSEETDQLTEHCTSTIPKCFSSPSPIQSPTNFYHMNSQMTPPSNGSNSMYNSSMAITHQPYSQSPRPHSQPFTHSDLSSEISAAISSDHLGSPAPTSPSLGPPDFDPPTSMPTEDTNECRFSSPAPSTPPQAPLSNSTPYPSYHTFGMDGENQNYTSTRPTPLMEYKVQDMSSKSLSGLESLVDQIPSIAEGESSAHSSGGMNMNDAGEHYVGNVYHSYSNTPTRVANNSPSPNSTYNYPSSNNSYNSLSVANLTNSSSSFVVGNLTSNYPHTSPNSYTNLMGSGASHSFIDHHSCNMPQMPVALPYPQLPYGQQFSNPYPPPPTLHMPSPNYPPYYNSSYPHSQPSPHSPTPTYLHNHMFDRIKPDIGYGGF